MPQREALAARLADFKPDAIGLSVITLSISEAIKTTAFLRAQFDVPILWGGVGTTLEPEIAIEHADLVCVGEGEQVIVEFADRLPPEIRDLPIVQEQYNLQSPALHHFW